jgi:hypothetical protein
VETEGYAETLGDTYHQISEKIASPGFEVRGLEGAADEEPSQ